MTQVPSPTLAKMIHAATRAGGMLRAIYNDRGTLNVIEKTSGDFVSEADHQAEAMIAADLGTDYDWLGEESGRRTGQDGTYCWIVDPLDGTTNFLKGLPHWAVSIALCKDDAVHCAVIHDPIKHETFSAERGKGAFLNGARLRVSENVPLSSALFATGVPAGGRITYLPACLRDLEKIMPQTAGIRRWGAASLDLAYVAAGRLDGYWERNLGAWDVAAGILLVKEAGGHIAPLWDGQSILSSGSFIATNAELGATLTSMVDPARK